MSRMAKSAAIGDPAPDFTLPSTMGDVTLAQRVGEGPVLLVFYPGDDTPVCTKQLCSYRDGIAGFGDLGIDVIAINGQSIASHAKFAQKHGLPFPLASDPDGKIRDQYGARGLLGMTKRVLVLVGRDGRVKWRHSDFPLFHRTADDVLRAVSELCA
jgi:thioredoxin-dependent peroxiredoxin